MKSIFQLKRFALLALLAIGGFAITSCEKDDSEVKLPYDLSRGVAISNEGSFGSSNASLSLYLPDEDRVENDIFTGINGRPLGDVFQSIGFAGNNAYLVINFSNKIEVVDKKTCVQVTTISGLKSPRYFTGVNKQKAYVTLWGDNGKVGVIDLTTNTLAKTIAVGNGPEKIVVTNGKAFVADCGGWGTDNRVSIINTNTDEVDATLTVGDNPKDLVVDRNGKVWVLCSGSTQYDANFNITSQTESQLVRINASTNEIEATISLGLTYHPSQLEVNPKGDVLYYGGDWGIAGIFSINITASEKASSPLINEIIYGFNVDPSNGTIYCLQAPTFTSDGKLKKYNSLGELQGTYTLGIGPNGAYFAD